MKCLHVNVSGSPAHTSLILVLTSHISPGGAVLEEGQQVPRSLLWESQSHVQHPEGCLYLLGDYVAITTFWSRKAQLFPSPQVPTQLGSQNSKQSSCSAWGDGRKNVLCAALSFRSQGRLRGRTLLSLEFSDWKQASRSHGVNQSNNKPLVLQFWKPSLEPGRS